MATPLSAHPVARRAGRLLDTVLDRTVVGGYSKLGHEVRRRLPDWPADPAPGSLTGRSLIVTGASSGLGIATAAGLARLGARVHLVVRDLVKGERARVELAAEVPGAEFRLWRCDLSDLTDVRRFAGAFTAAETELHGIVHNAGVLPAARAESRQGHELTLATHVLGPVLLTELLRPVLAAAGDSRVILVSSGGMYSQRLPAVDLEYRVGTYRGATAYARTKRMQVALTPVLARRWASDGIAVHAMHPGWADTPGIADSLPGFHRITERILREPDSGADTVIWLAATAPQPSAGRFWHDRRARPTHVLPHTRETGRDRALLWDWCRNQLGLAL